MSVDAAAVREGYFAEVLSKTRRQRLKLESLLGQRDLLLAGIRAQTHLSLK